MFRKNDEFIHWKTPLSYSFGLHFFIFFSLLILGGQFLLSSQSVKDAQFIKTAVKVDIVAMPTHTLKELKSMQVSSESKKALEEEQTAMPVTSKNDVEFKEKKKNFLDKIKKIGNKNIDKKKKKLDKKNTVDSEVKSLILEGNKLSKGSATTGEYSDEEQDQFVSYVQSVSEQVKQMWKLPSYLIDQELSCKIQVFLSSSGDVLRLVIIESSGNDEFDQKAKDAIINASPFDSPEEDIKGRLIDGDLGLAFPL